MSCNIELSGENDFDGIWVMAWCDTHDAVLTTGISPISLSRVLLAAAEHAADLRVLGL